MKPPREMGRRPAKNSCFRLVSAGRSGSRSVRRRAALLCGGGGLEVPFIPSPLTDRWDALRTFFGGPGGAMGSPGCRLRAGRGGGGGGAGGRQWQPRIIQLWKELVAGGWGNTTALPCPQDYHLLFFDPCYPGLFVIRAETGDLGSFGTGEAGG